MTNLFYLVPAAAVVALLFAYLFFKQMMKESEGTATMKQIAKFVREGAMAYLKQQYKVVVIVFVILALLFNLLAPEFFIGGRARVNKVFKLFIVFGEVNRACSHIDNSRRASLCILGACVLCTNDRLRLEFFAGCALSVVVLVLELSAALTVKALLLSLRTL